LQTGRIRADVNPPLGGKTDFTVMSPMVTASVRGTSFDFDGVNLSVDEGRVHVTGGDQTAVYVGPGHQSVSDPETGRTAGAVEMVRSELTLPTAVVITENIPVSPVIIPAAAAGRTVGFEW
jgi:ferric-dicitrate binding protein FerR (iron transport regulator)